MALNGGRLGCLSLTPCAPTQEEAERFAGGLYSADNPEDDFGFVGTPKQLVEQMRPFIDLGVDYFMLDCGGFPNLTTLEMFVSEALPALTKPARLGSPKPGGTNG